MQSSQSRTAWAFLAPSLALYGIYVAFPVIFSFYLSLTDWDGLSLNLLPMCLKYQEASCFENFYELWFDPVFWGSLKNNFLWLMLYGASPLIGLGFALFFHSKGKYGSFLKSLLFAPMVFSLVVVGLIWGWFLQPEFGLLEFFLKQVGVIGPTENLTLLASFEWATFGLIVAASWPHASYCMILYLAGLSNLNKSVIEAAELDGAGKGQLFWHVVLPMLRPATVIVMIVTAIGALRTFEIVAIITGGGPANSSNVLANYMYEQTFKNFRYGYGAAIAVALFCLSVFLIYLYLRKSRGLEEA